MTNTFDYATNTDSMLKHVSFVVVSKLSAVKGISSFLFDASGLEIAIGG